MLKQKHGKNGILYGQRGTGLFFFQFAYWYFNDFFVLEQIT